MDNLQNYDKFSISVQSFVTINLFQNIV